MEKNLEDIADKIYNNINNIVEDECNFNVNANVNNNNIKWPNKYVLVTSTLLIYSSYIIVSMYYNGLINTKYRYYFLPPGVSFYGYTMMMIKSTNIKKLLYVNALTYLFFAILYICFLIVNKLKLKRKI